jgi:crotonobetainyl-CoA:carnitine CoA-transferase CaiB-like acyl-CoA transferase
MTSSVQRSVLMAGYYMLDLSDEKERLCGKTFADMGAEVIKVEMSGGPALSSSSRCLAESE